MGACDIGYFLLYSDCLIFEKMPAILASSPGKIILLGEHSVVYGQPAIAVPVTQVKAKAMVTTNPLSPPGTVRVDAPDIHFSAVLDHIPDENPLAVAIRSVFSTLNVTRPPALTLRITSSIPIASGLGSGAAVTIAILRALSAFLGRPLPDEQVSELAFQVERIHHSTPSGIDNAVITYNQPVFFIRGQPIQFIQVPKPFCMVIGVTGIQASTAEVVGDLRRRFQIDPAPYEAAFKNIGDLATAGREAIQGGRIEALGSLLNQNHLLLQEIGVSSPELDRLVEAALQAGATGAKLSGAGWGGNMIALASPDSAPDITRSLIAAGAVQTITTWVGSGQQQV